MGFHENCQRKLEMSGFFFKIPEHLNIENTGSAFFPRYFVRRQKCDEGFPIHIETR